jgi:hypothetical protein
MCDRGHLRKPMRDDLKQSAALLHDLGPLHVAYFLSEIAAGRDLHQTLRRCVGATKEQITAMMDRCGEAEH